MNTTTEQPMTLAWRRDNYDLDGSVSEFAQTRDFQLGRTIRPGTGLDSEVSLTPEFVEFHGTPEEVANFLWALAAQALNLACALRAEP